jgi:hypothetical protein
MTERIVVTFWMPYAGLSPVSGRSFVQRARALTRRAEALGGTLIALGAQGCAFALDVDALEEAIVLSTAIIDEARPPEIRWACGVTDGALEHLVEDGGHGGLAWGPAVALGAALARTAAPGEVLFEPSLKGANRLLSVGRRVRRDAGRLVRGMVLDARQPWCSVAAGHVKRLRTARLLGREDPSALLWMPGSLAILRADPGLGGTRVLNELAGIVAPSPYLLIVPSGAALEPLGALRRALARVRGAEGAARVEPELEPALRRLVAGDGVPLDTAAAIVVSYLTGGDQAAPGALLIDDATEVDATTIEACARAVVSGERSFPCVARLDATSPPPAALTGLPKGHEMELKPFDASDAEALVTAVAGGALDPALSRRWVRRGGATPLGVIEALALSLAVGELAWEGDALRARRRSAGRGKPMQARDWIARRARTMSSPIEQLVLAIVALLGGDVTIGRLERVLAAANVQASARDVVQSLTGLRWLTSAGGEAVALPTRSHREAILGELTDDSLRALIHGAIGRTLEGDERGLGRAEIAYHLARAGDARRAARIALDAARAAGQLDLQQGTTSLIAYARELDPSLDEEARVQLASSVTRASRMPSAPDLYGVAVSSVAPRPGADHVDVAVSQPAVLLAMREAESNASDSEPPTMMSIEMRDDDGSTVTLIEEEMPIVDGDPLSEPGTMLGLAPSTLGAVPETGTYPSTAVPRTTTDPAPAPFELAPDSATSADRQKCDPRIGTKNSPGGDFEVWGEGPGSSSSDARVLLGNARTHERGEAASMPGGTSHDLGTRLTELAKEALLGADTRAFERWTEGLVASGEHGRFADRMHAIVHLSHGDTGEALRLLRSARAELEATASRAERCQAALALGVALAAAGRPDEALLEALEALARAREAGDDDDNDKGVLACLAFLAKLYASVERPEDAARLRRQAHRSERVQV